MKTSITRLHRAHSSRRTPSPAPREEKAAYQSDYGISFMEERLFCLRTQGIVDHLLRIALFIGELKKYGFKDSGVLERIGESIVRLRSGDMGYPYSETVRSLTKYLWSVRTPSPTTDLQTILFYKKFIETALTEIIRSLDSLEEGVS